MEVSNNDVAASEFVLSAAAGRHNSALTWGTGVSKEISDVPWLNHLLDLGSAHLVVAFEFLAPATAAIMHSSKVLGI